MENKKEKKIPFDGFGSVIEMLKHADKAFRERILRNIAAKDPDLAERLLHATNDAISDQQYQDSREALRRSQRTQSVRGYGRQ